MLDVVLTSMEKEEISVKVVDYSNSRCEVTKIFLQHQRITDEIGKIIKHFAY